MTEITDPALEGYSDQAWEEPVDGELTEEQLALRIRLKTEQAAQDAGYLTPPQPDVEDSVETEEPPVVPEEEEPEEPEEEAEDETEGEEEPEEPEATDEEPDEAPEEDADDELAEAWAKITARHEALARYKSPDEADKGFAEKDQTILRQYREMNERWMAEQRQQEEQPQQQQPQRFDEEAWSEWSQEVVSQGAGVEGAKKALEDGGQQAFDIYVAHWKNSDDLEDRIRAEAFNNEVQRQYSAERAIRAVSPALEVAKKRTVEDEAEIARSTVAREIPDYEEYKDEMDRLILEDGVISGDDKLWLSDLSKTGIEGKVRALHWVYMAAKANKVPVRQRARAVERRRRTTTADAAKIAATVSTSEGTAARTPPSESELAILQKRNRIREKLGQPLLEE